MKHLLAAICIPGALLLAGCPDTKLPKPPTQIPEPKAQPPVSAAPPLGAPPSAYSAPRETLRMKA